MFIFRLNLIFGGIFFVILLYSFGIFSVWIGPHLDHTYNFKMFFSISQPGLVSICCTYNGKACINYEQWPDHLDMESAW